METPPHAWGRLDCLPVDEREGGNTPTCVGKTCMPVSSSGKMWKHPHMRGEDSALPSFRQLKAETPPHAWGRHLFQLRKPGIRGNTPTCVGKTEFSNNMSVVLKNTPTCVGKTLNDH